jgi:hypothetical protein
MKETFEQYLQRLKDRRTEDDYKYTDEDFEKHKDYISDCCKNGMSVYKCLELMYFAEKDMDDQLFNREPKHETLEEASERIRKKLIHAPVGIIPNFNDGFEQGAKWQKEQILDFLYEEITERRDYSSSKMCEKVIEFIEQFKNK